MSAPLVLALALIVPNADDAGSPPEAIRAAAERALVPIQRSLAVYPEHRDCFTCHNQAVPLIALDIARPRGFAVDASLVTESVELTLADLESALEAYRAGRGQGGGVTRAGYALWTLEAGGHPADEVTAAVAGFVLGREVKQDHWSSGSNRPPSEGSEFTATAVALRALRAYPPESEADRARLDERRARARDWLARARPRDTEDRVFRLWGLHLAGADREVIDAAARDLLDAQRDDGGWSQLPDRAADAYATGSALVALHEAGGLPTDDPAYRRGLAYLMRTQADDGTWHVASRSKPFQTYFESGFPYGKDQFVSIAASSWAAAALALACPAPAGP